MIYVTHDQFEAMTLGERIVVFNKGRIEQVGTPLELYRQPANLFVASFLGIPKMNLIDLDISEQGAARICIGFLNVPAHMQSFFGGRVTLGFRAQHVQLVPEPLTADLRGVVTLVEHLGDMAIAHIEYADERPALSVNSKATDPCLPTAGEQVALNISWSQTSWFDEQGVSL